MRHVTHSETKSDAEDGVGRDRHQHEAGRDGNVEYVGIRCHEHGEFESEGKQDSPSPMPPCPIADDRQKELRDLVRRIEEIVSSQTV